MPPTAIRAGESRYEWQASAIQLRPTWHELAGAGIDGTFHEVHGYSAEAPLTAEYALLYRTFEDLPV